MVSDCLSVCIDRLTDAAAPAGRGHPSRLDIEPTATLVRVLCAHKVDHFDRKIIGACKIVQIPLCCHISLCKCRIAFYGTHIVVSDLFNTMNSLMLSRSKTENQLIFVNEYISNHKPLIALVKRKTAFEKNVGYVLCITWRVSYARGAETWGEGITRI